jgi:hypothetical protein
MDRSRSRIRRLTWLSRILLGVLLIACGVLLGLAVWHLWFDHQQFHILIGVINKIAATHPDLFR